MMKRKIQMFVGLLLCVVHATATGQSEGSSFECEFDRHYAVYLNEDRSERYNKQLTLLSFVDNTTTSETLQMDGAMRAANSERWSLLPTSIGGTYLGDRGELLTVFYEPGSGIGEYRASLQWSALGYAFASIGTCEGTP